MQSKSDCVVCHLNKDTLYKCSACYAKYCGVVCYKQHKADQCQGKKQKVPRPDAD